MGVLKKKNTEKHPISVSSCVKTLKDLKKYEAPDPFDPSRFKILEKIIEKHDRKKAIILHLNDVVSIPGSLMGYENFLISIATEPGLISGLIELSVDINLKLAKEALKRGIKIVYTGDDFAYKGY